MINRNRNSAAAKAQADMKRAVNSSRRSASRLNSSRYTKDKMIKAMEAAGYWYDDIDSNDADYVVFRGDYGSMTFDNLNEVADWLDNVVFDDPAVAEEVYTILNSNRRVNSSRHMSYKTRKAVEYSINCARRRARLNCSSSSESTREDAVKLLANAYAKYKKYLKPKMAEVFNMSIEDWNDHCAACNTYEDIFNSISTPALYYAIDELGLARNLNYRNQGWL